MIGMCRPGLSMMRVCRNEMKARRCCGSLAKHAATVSGTIKTATRAGSRRVGLYETKRDIEFMMPHSGAQLRTRFPIDIHWWLGLAVGFKRMRLAKKLFAGLAARSHAPAFAAFLFCRLLTRSSTTAGSA